MERLTTSQIADFNNPLAFARDRQARIGQQLIGVRSANVIRTGNIEESFRLVTGAASRLETLENNLNTMLQLADSGQRARNNERQLQEVYGKLRSLSAGFDQIIDAIQFKGQAVFMGKDVQLNLGPGTRPLTLEASKLLTYGDNSLNLSSADPSADIRINYRTDDLILNAGYDIIGLDIESAGFIRGSNPALELENGDYKVKISYAGAQSSVELRTPTGTLIERKDAVDLAGSGRRWVDFEAGIRLTFSMESILQSVDKYDFETNGPAELSASMNYRRIEGHVLRTGDAPLPDRAEIRFNAPLEVGDGRIAVRNPTLAPVDPTRRPLQSGSYTLQVQYFGENSVIRLSDGLGRLQAYQFGVDLRGDGVRQIDLGVGLTFDLDVDNFSTHGASLTLPLDYQRERAPLEQFDFREYAKLIESAIEVVAEQRGIIAKAQADIEETNRLRNIAATSSVPSGIAFARTSALNILNGGGDNSFFRPASANVRLNTLATQIFGITTALPTQANITPESLAQAQMASASGWLNTFS